MAKRPVPAHTQLASQEIGQNLATWRRMLNITSEQMAQKAGVSRATISRVEGGDMSVSFATILNMCNVLGIGSALQQATDPYSTDLGRARASLALPERVRN